MKQGSVGVLDARAHLLVITLIALSACHWRDSDGPAASVAAETPTQPEPEPEPEEPVEEPPVEEEPPADEQPPPEEEPPVEEAPESILYQADRVPGLFGTEGGELHGRTINNHGHVGGQIWFLDDPQPYAVGFVWFGDFNSVDANELIHLDDPLRETTIITDVMRINDDLWMAGQAADPTELSPTGRPTPFGFGWNANTGRLHEISERNVFIWPYMAPDGKVYENGGSDMLVSIWDGESSHYWEYEGAWRNPPPWLDLTDCTMLVIDDRGIPYDFGVQAGGPCWALHEHLFTYPEESDPIFIPTVQGRESETLSAYVTDMNDHGQMLIDGCFYSEDAPIEERWDCGTFVLTPLTSSDYD